jgi:N-acetylmuramoyl-L-alanine amidase
MVGEGMLGSKKNFLLLFLFVSTTIFSVDQGIIVKNIYHHRGIPHKHNNGLELGSVVFYFSGAPSIHKISSELSSKGMQRNVYKINNAQCTAEKMLMVPITSERYAVTMQNVGDDLHLVITYNARTVVSELDTFDSISLQKGLIIYFLNRMKCGRQQPSVLSVKKKNRQKTVVIDCGHGGNDAGAVGYDGVTEKNVVLRVGLRVAQLLKEANIRVLLTRSSDVDMSLDARTSYANQHNADLFISIHANASANVSAQGIDTFCMQPSLLHVISQVNMSACDNALRDLLKVRADASNRLAQSVHQSVITNVKKQYPMVVDRKVKYEVAQILLGSHMPAMLIELGFVTHAQEAKRLRDQRYQYLLAQCICDGIIAYLKE